MTLIDVVSQLDQLDDEGIIYALEPWTPASPALVAPGTEDGGDPPKAVTGDLTYYIEVSIAREFLEGFENFLKRPATDLEKCLRLTRYAIDDA